MARRRLLGVGALVVLAPRAARASAASAADLDALLRRIGGQAERRASFVERRHSALTKTPIESRGQLRFRAPDRLEKQTVAPVRETVRIEGGTVTIEGAPVRGVPDRRSVKLSDVPLLAALVESLLATLAGDLARLKRHYEPVLVHEARGWALTLTPLAQALRDAVARVVLRGQGDLVTSVDIFESSGDRIELAITPLA